MVKYKLTKESNEAREEELKEKGSHLQITLPYSKPVSPHTLSKTSPTPLLQDQSLASISPHDFL